MDKIFMDKFLYKKEEGFNKFKLDMMRLFNIDIKNIEGYLDIESFYSIKKKNP